MVDHSYSADFLYRYRNSYSDKLKDFDAFVFRDNEAEKFSGKWNELVFKNNSPICLEIGTGFGYFMIDYCENHPTENFVGLDYRFKRSFTLAKKLNNLKYRNFSYLRAKGERIEFIFGESEVSKIFYFFPDPWPKNKHHKKRLFQEPFLQAAYKILRPGGQIFVKTDHLGYAEWMKEVIAKNSDFNLLLESYNLRTEHPEHFLTKNITKFEKIFIAQGKKINAFVLETKKQ